MNVSTHTIKPYSLVKKVIEQFYSDRKIPFFTISTSHKKITIVGYKKQTGKLIGSDGNILNKLKEHLKGFEYPEIEVMDEKKFKSKK